MRATATFLSALILCACGWDIEAREWPEAAKLCDPYGGILAADIRGRDKDSFRIDAICKDGARITKRVYVEVRPK